MCWETWGSPLHKGMTSRPTICRQTTEVSVKDNMLPMYGKVRQQVSHDCVHLILYGVHSKLTKFLVQQCLSGLSRAPDMVEPVQEMLQMCGQGIDFERAVFLLLLNIDMEMKEIICRGFPAENIKGIVKEKAASFLHQLNEKVVPAWQGNEFKNVNDLVEAARAAYLVA